MIVEDSAPMRERIRSLVEEFGPVQVVGTAASIGSALALLAEKQPEVVVLDVFLGDGNSFGLITEIKRARFPCAVIILTSFATPESRAHCLELGADWFFEKSQEFLRVPEVLAELHRRKQIRGSLS